MAGNENISIKMMNGVRYAIAEGLTSKSAYIRLNALQWAAYYNVADPAVIAKIKDLKTDNDSDMGYMVSDFAIAALVVLGAEKYRGKDKDLINLINNFVFQKDIVNEMKKRYYFR